MTSDQLDAALAEAALRMQWSHIVCLLAERVASAMRVIGWHRAWRHYTRVSLQHAAMYDQLLKLVTAAHEAFAPAVEVRR